jgi:acyl-CoA dehydrogenase
MHHFKRQVGLQRRETLMEFDLNEEQQMLRDSVRKLLKDEFPKSYARECDEQRRFPRELWNRMAAMGWLGLPIPEQYGGTGGSELDMSILVEELARGVTAGALAYVVSLCFGGKSLQYFGEHEQKEEYLPKLARGEILFALGLTEASGGSDILSLTTRAEVDGDDFVINGEKMFITLAHEADFMITVARTGEPVPKKSYGLSLLITDMKSPGITVERLDQFGMRATGINHIVLKDLRVPRANVLGEMNKGWYHLLHTLNNERITLGAMGVGIAQAALDDALEYAKQRTAFGKPIGQLQAIQHRIANMAAEIECARWQVYRAAWLQSEGRPCGYEATMAKMVASEVAYRTASTGMHILAGQGYLMEQDMQRYFRDARLGTFSPVSNDMARNFIAEQLGLPRSY